MGRWCRNSLVVRTYKSSSLTIEIGESGFIAVDVHGDEMAGARLLRRVAPGINMMETAVSGVPLLPEDELERGLVGLALGAREASR